MKLLLTGSVVLLVLGAIGASRAAGRDRKLEVTFVSHEGFLVRGTQGAVLFDGVLSVGTSADDTLPKATFDRLTGRRPPVGTIDALLVSHGHSDHFDPRVAGPILAGHPEATFVALAEVHEALRAELPASAPKNAMVELRWTEPGPIERSVGLFKVRMFRCPHEASEFYREEVVVYVVEIDGRRVLHAADAELRPDLLATMHLEDEHLDLAILPYSFLSMPGAEKLYEKRIGAKTLIAVHLPAADLAASKAQVRRKFARAIFFDKTLQSIRL